MENESEVQGWETIQQQSASGNSDMQKTANILAMKKLVYSVVNLRLFVGYLQNDLGSLKVNVEILNKNLEKFNEESSKWAKRTFWTNFFIALATLAASIAAFVAIFYKR